MAHWHSIQDESVHVKADFVRDKLKEVEELIRDVEEFAVSNQVLDGYLEVNHIRMSSSVSNTLLVNLKDTIIKQIYGDRCDTITSRKDFNDAKKEEG